MTASKSDNAISQFCDFINNYVKKNSGEFHNFDKATDRLDVFYFQSSCFKIEKAKELNCFKTDFYCKPWKCICRASVQCKKFDFGKQYESRNH